MIRNVFCGVIFGILINPVKLHPETITQKDKEFVDDLNYERIEFPVSKKWFP